MCNFDAMAKILLFAYLTRVALYRCIELLKIFLDFSVELFQIVTSPFFEPFMKRFSSLKLRIVEKMKTLHVRSTVRGRIVDLQRSCSDNLFDNLVKID